MKIFSELLGMLAFRGHALRAQAERRASVAGISWFTIGFLVYVIVRHSVYAGLPDLAFQEFEFVQTFLSLVEILLFLLILYVPVLILLGNAFSGDGLGFSFSRQEYQTHISALLPLWGVLFLIASPFQWLIPFIPLPAIPLSVIPLPVAANIVMDISFGILVLSILLFIYTIWSIKQLSYLSWAQSIGVFALSWITFPILFLLSSFIFALPFFILIPLLYLTFSWLRDHFASQANERGFQQNLHVLTLNPQDADAHYQLGLIHLKRRNLDAAKRYFENALKIEPADPDYHYYLGQTYELQGEWHLALEQHEETYRLNPEYGLGDIFREVGKAYLHAGNAEKAREFLNYFLAKRSSDPQGRYWLAVAMQKIGDMDQMRFQLNILTEQARANPRFFRKGNREWIYRARNLSRNSRTAH
jgi:tetratricopeptide (TPR) repeat protein